jgi:hypothetical protein
MRAISMILAAVLFGTALASAQLPPRPPAPSPPEAAGGTATPTPQPEPVDLPKLIAGLVKVVDELNTRLEKVEQELAETKAKLAALEAAEPSPPGGTP